MIFRDDAIALASRYIYLVQMRHLSGPHAGVSDDGCDFVGLLWIESAKFKIGRKRTGAIAERTAKRAAQDDRSRSDIARDDLGFHVGDVIDADRDFAIHL